MNLNLAAGCLVTARSCGAIKTLEKPLYDLYHSVLKKNPRIYLGKKPRKYGKKT